MEKHRNLPQITPFLDANSNTRASENSKESNSTFRNLEILEEDHNKKEQGLEDKRNALVKEIQIIATWLYQKTPNTRSAYESDIKKFLGFYYGKSLKEITTAHITVYFKQNPHLKDSTKARIKSSLSSLFKYCVRVGFLEKNPAENLDPIKVSDQTQFRVLAHEEIVRMIELEENLRNKIMIRLMYKTGIRVSELCSLKFSNLRERDKSYFLIVIGKGNKTRTIGLNKELFDELNSLRVVENETLSVEAFIFRAKVSKEAKISRVAVWKIIKNAAVRARVNEKASPHWTRHSHATKALEMGEDIRIIQTTLGHDSIVTTTKYAKVFPGKSSGEKIDI